MIENINAIYREKGLKGVYSALHEKGIDFKKEVIEFGLDTNKNANERKKLFINHDELKFHYYSKGVKSKKTGYNYNIIRGIKLNLI